MQAEKKEGFTNTFTANFFIYSIEICIDSLVSLLVLVQCPSLPWFLMSKAVLIIPSYETAEHSVLHIIWSLTMYVFSSSELFISSSSYMIAVVMYCWVAPSFFLYFNFEYVFIPFGLPLWPYQILTNQDTFFKLSLKSEH